MYLDIFYFLDLKYHCSHLNFWFNYGHQRELSTYRSVMATCSSMAEPVLVFQLPDMDVLLMLKTHKVSRLWSSFGFDIQWSMKKEYVHVSFVVGTNLLDSDVILGVDERFCGAVGLCESHDTGYVLELSVIVHLHLNTTNNHFTWENMQKCYCVTIGWWQFFPYNVDYITIVWISCIASVFLGIIFCLFVCWPKNIEIPFQFQSGHVQSSQQQEMTACSPEEENWSFDAFNANFDETFQNKWKYNAAHHFLVVRIKGLFDQRELVNSQLSAGIDKLSKLHTHKYRIKM